MKAVSGPKDSERGCKVRSSALIVRVTIIMKENTVSPVTTTVAIVAATIRNVPRIAPASTMAVMASMAVSSPVEDITTEEVMGSSVAAIVSVLPTTTRMQSTA